MPRGLAKNKKEVGSAMGANLQLPRKATSLDPLNSESTQKSPCREKSSEPMDWAPFAEEELVDNRGSPILIDSDATTSASATEGENPGVCGHDATIESPEGIMELDGATEKGVQSGGGLKKDLPPEGSIKNRPSEQGNLNHPRTSVSALLRDSKGPPGSASLRESRTSPGDTAGSASSRDNKTNPGNSSQGNSRRSQKADGDPAESKVKSKSKSKGRAKQQKSDKTEAMPTSAPSANNGGSQDNSQSAPSSQPPQSTSSEEAIQALPGPSPHPQHLTPEVPGVGGQSGSGEFASVTESLDGLQLEQMDLILEAEDAASMG
ncbi:hypothetical protein FRC01_013845 [Tulasnella sp. 417]|nr:hypothetical protein FRC01_013845 [Tulasnella sp. 417]